MSRNSASEVEHGSGEGTSAFGLTAIWARGSELSRLSRWAMAKQLVSIAWRSVRSAPLTSLLTLATMSVALFLLAAFCLLLQTVNRVAVETRSDVALTLYLKGDSAGDARVALEGELRSRPEVASVDFVSSDAALAEFRSSLGDEAALLEGLAERNPLPASFAVKFKPEFGSLQEYQALSSEYAGHPLIDHIHYSGGVVGRLGAMMQTLRVGGGGAIVFMLFATGFLMANTIKLALYAHRSEIEIMRLVGATQAFVRAPFLIEGGAQGFLGALLGLTLLSILVGGVNRFLSRSELLSGFAHALPPLDVVGVALVVFAGIAVGLLGSFLAVRRFSVE